jgi:hypothetical protein
MQNPDWWKAPPWIGFSRMGMTGSGEKSLGPSREVALRLVNRDRAAPL